MKHLFSCSALIAGALLMAPVANAQVLPGHNAAPAARGIHAPMGGRSVGSGPYLNRGGHNGWRANNTGWRGNGWGVGAAAAGIAAGAVVGGAIAANNGYYSDNSDPGYYAGDPGYYAGGPGYYSGAPAPADTYSDADQGYVTAAPAPQGYAYGTPAPGYADDSNDGSVAYCEQTFKSYNPSTGTYLGYDGQRHSCP